jgi:hypothetical protein
MTPLSNSYLTEAQLCSMEPFYPLQAFVCDRCFLVQLGVYESPDRIFTDYPYFSSCSDSWLSHAEHYTETTINRFELGPKSQIVEIASNDGYLLQYFKQRNIPILGIEPARNVAAAAIEAGIPTIVEFFGTPLMTRLSREGVGADLLIANNVLAHVPDLNDFVHGIEIGLKPHGIATIEFPHLLQLIKGNQFDTIYHEHFSYFSLRTAQRVFARHSLEIFDVDELPSHGGSLRIYARRRDDTSKPVTERIAALVEKERAGGLDDLSTYTGFDARIRETKRRLLSLLVDLKRCGKRIVGYGAPAKGNTLLNYCGIRTDFIEFTVDRNPRKQNRFLPGTHIPIYHPDRIKEVRPDYVLILPWNLREEITDLLSYIRQWGGQFVIPIPNAEVVP